MGTLTFSGFTVTVPLAGWAHPWMRYRSQCATRTNAFTRRLLMLGRRYGCTCVVYDANTDPLGGWTCMEGPNTCTHTRTHTDGVWDLGSTDHTLVAVPSD